MRRLNLVFDDADFARLQARKKALGLTWAGVIRRGLEVKG